MAIKATARPARLNLYPYRGDDFDVQFPVEDVDGNPIDISGYTFAAQIRDVEDDSLIASFTFDLTGAAGGLLIMSLGRADTAELPDVANWDMQVTDTADKQHTWYAGIVGATGEITEV